ncbi:ABC transporter ATP-binding protein [Herbaspirillum autotrophicum]|uniref:ABC transporter ATP-binding protein n=1 Tax=Herbaspirillum autotrophicum TaxID=180195 RepID=UPI00067AEE8F|nr:ABC transporter ATP-binding protein [Herbaspirillum autotrophicum]
MSAVPVLHAGGLTVHAGTRPLLTQLEWRVHAGEFWCVLGPNGIGKSTLLHAVAGLQPPAAGQIAAHGKPLAAMSPNALARWRGLLSQQQQDAFSCSVLESVVAGRFPYQNGFGWESPEDFVLARQALASLNMTAHSADDVLHLSGGERQRVALAALLVQDPALLLLDEPTSHQDLPAQLAMMRLLRNLTQQSPAKAVVAACHDLHLVSRFATHALIIGHERHWQGPLDEVLRPAILGLAFNCEFDVITTAQGSLFLPLDARS